MRRWRSPRRATPRASTPRRAPARSSISPASTAPTSRRLPPTSTSTRPPPPPRTSPTGSSPSSPAAAISAGIRSRSRRLPSRHLCRERGEWIETRGAATANPLPLWERVARARAEPGEGAPRHPENSAPSTRSSPRQTRACLCGFTNPALVKRGRIRRSHPARRVDDAWAYDASTSILIDLMSAPVPSPGTPGWITSRSPVRSVRRVGTRQVSATA